MTNEELLAAQKVVVDEWMSTLEKDNLIVPHAVRRGNGQYYLAGGFTERDVWRWLAFEHTLEGTVVHLKEGRNLRQATLHDAAAKSAQQDDTSTQVEATSVEQTPEQVISPYVAA